MHGLPSSKRICPPCPSKNRFCHFKDKTLCSLQEIECFLDKCSKARKCFCLYKLLK